MSKKTEANRIVKRHIIWAMGAGLIPIPVIDFTAVTAVQIDMLGQLAKHYGVEYEASAGKTFVAALTGTTVATIGASIIKALPGIGTVFGGVSMSVMAGASTYAVAQVAIPYLETGSSLGNVDLNTAKQSYKKAYEEGKEVVSDLEGDQEASQDVFEQLEKLGRLKEQGIISDEEFKTQKQKLLDRI